MTKTKRSQERFDCDSFACYWREVARIPLLSADEQHALAVEFAATRNPALSARLVTTNLRLVAKIAREYASRPEDLPDLLQEGNAGLVRAVERYDPSRGAKLITYAAWWIRAYIMQYLMANRRAVKLGTTRAQRKQFLAGEVWPSDVSLNQDASSGEHDGDRAGRSAARIDRLVARDEERPDVQVEEAEHHAKLARVLARLEAQLDPRGRDILRRRWLDDEHCSLADLAKRHAVSSERVRQVEQKVFDRLRSMVTDELAA